MLVDDYGVEADLLGKNKLGDVALIELMPDLGIVVLVRKIDPQRMIIFLVRRQVRVRHEVHEIETNAHRSLPEFFLRPARIAAGTASFHVRLHRLGCILRRRTKGRKSKGCANAFAYRTYWGQAPKTKPRSLCYLPPPN
jgi:hypothetical protein